MPYVPDRLALHLPALTLLLASPSALAAAKCDIEIEDVYKGQKYLVEETLDVVADDAVLPSRAFFDLPGNTTYTCTLAFFDFDTGTMLSCEDTSTSGLVFFQSDRTGLKESSATNHLTFRVRNGFYVIKSVCKPSSG